MASNDYLLAPLLTWGVAQFVKYLLASRTAGNYRNFRIILQSGSMPSVHTAAVTALAVAIGGDVGLRSPEFALSLIFTIIVAYDAMQVRRATGEQGTVLRELVTLAKLKLEKPVYYAKGHRPSEVLIGAAIGLAAGFAVLSF